MWRRVCGVGFMIYRKAVRATVQQTGGDRRETGGGRRETDGDRWATGGDRLETGGDRWETGGGSGRRGSVWGLGCGAYRKAVGAPVQLIPHEERLHVRAPGTRCGGEGSGFRVQGSGLEFGVWGLGFGV